MKLTIDGKSYEVEIHPDAVVVGGVSYKTTVVRDNGESTVRVAGRPYKVKVQNERTVVVDGRQFTVEMNGRAAMTRQQPKVARTAAKRADNCPDTGAVRAPMPGAIVAVRVNEGEQVARGAVLLILEAMKMKNEIKAPHDGTVTRILVAAGQNVKNGDVMVLIE
jgi:glutaconyl-CoA/methylmalonyl-CoA decarboxylase subunit gamma